MNERKTHETRPHCLHIRRTLCGIADKERSIRSEIHQLWLKMEMAEANLNKANRAVEIAKEQAALAKAAFEAGASTNLEVVDANSMQFAAEIAAASEELNLTLTVLRLQKATRMYDMAGGASSAGAGMGGGATGGMGGEGGGMGGDMGAGGAGAGMGSASGGMGGMGGM